MSGLFYCHIACIDLHQLVERYITTVQPNEQNSIQGSTLFIPLKVCRETRILLCRQGFWCTGVKIGPGASFADTINLTQKLRCYHVAQMCHHW